MDQWKEFRPTGCMYTRGAPVYCLFEKPVLDQMCVGHGYTIVKPIACVKQRHVGLVPDGTGWVKVYIDEDDVPKYCHPEEKSFFLPAHDNLLLCPQGVQDDGLPHFRLKRHSTKNFYKKKTCCK